MGEHYVALYPVVGMFLEVFIFLGVLAVVWIVGIFVGLVFEAWQTTSAGRESARRRDRLDLSKHVRRLRQAQYKRTEKAAQKYATPVVRRPWR